MTTDDRRTAERHTLPIEMEFWCDETRHRARIEDLSEGGAYVYTGLNWPQGKTIEFSFVIPGDDAPVTGTGTVVWTEYMGFGVRFDTVAGDGRERIRDLVGTQQVLDRRGAGFAEKLRAASGG